MVCYPSPIPDFAVYTLLRGYHRDCQGASLNRLGRHSQFIQSQLFDKEKHKQTKNKQTTNTKTKNKQKTNKKQQTKKQTNKQKQKQTKTKTKNKNKKLLFFNRVVPYLILKLVVCLDMLYCVILGWNRGESLV